VALVSDDQAKVDSGLDGSEDDRLYCGDSKGELAAAELPPRELRAADQIIGSKNRPCETQDLRVRTIIIINKTSDLFSRHKEGARAMLVSKCV
jgi:hypothetical protein